MQTADSLSPGLRVFLFTASVVITIAGLRLGAPLLVPIALALFITIVSLPLVNRMVSRGAPAWIAVFAVLLLNLTSFTAVVWLLAASLGDVGPALSIYVARLQEMEASVLAWLAGHGIQVGVFTTFDLISYERLIGLVTAFIRGTTDILASAFLVALVAIFLLAEAPGFSMRLRAALGDRVHRFDWLTGVLLEVQRYLAIKTLISALTGLVIGVAAWLLGVDFALLWGLLAFFLNFIPNIGSFLAAVPAVLIALLQQGIGTAVALTGVYVGVNLLLGNLIEPAVLGRRLGLSTAVIILSLVFWGWAWGAVGMFLSVPLTMVVRILLEHTEQYRWIAALMAGAPRRAIVTPKALSG